MERTTIQKHGFDLFVNTDVVNQPEHAWWQTTFPRWRLPFFSHCIRFCHPKKTFVDIDVGRSASTLFTAPLSGHVLVLNPDPENLSVLGAHLRVNDCTNVTLLPVVLGSQARQQTLVSVPTTTTGVVVHGSCVADVADLEVVPSDHLYRRTKRQGYEQYVKQANNSMETVFSFFDKQLDGQTVSMLHCDMHGHEHTVLEDVVRLAQSAGRKGGHDVPVYFSCYTDQWPAEYQAQFLRTLEDRLTFLNDDGAELSANDLADVLFAQGAKRQGFLALNPRQLRLYRSIPIYIIGYNNLTYVRNMVNQLALFTQDITVIDNCSTYPALLNYYKCDFAFKLWRQRSNFGYLVAYRFNALYPDNYVITDPDLELHPSTPLDFLEQLRDIGKRCKAAKIGLALRVDDHKDFVQYPNYMPGYAGIYEWEKHFWQRCVQVPGRPEYTVYQADVDTTFALHRKGIDNPHSIRVAGAFTCRHLPWYGHVWTDMPSNERHHYKNDNTSTSLRWQW